MSRKFSKGAWAYFRSLKEIHHCNILFKNLSRKPIKFWVYVPSRTYFELEYEDGYFRFLIHISENFGKAELSMVIFRIEVNYESSNAVVRYACLSDYSVEATVEEFNKLVEVYCEKA